MKNWYKTKHTFLHPYLVQPTGFQQSWIYLHFPPDKQACLSPSGVCEPDSAQSAERVHLQVGSTNAKKTGSLPFGQYFSLAAGKQASRRFTLKCEPDSAQSAERVQLTKVRQKWKEDTLRVLFSFLVEPTGVEPVSENLLI